jgi:hypothetical protein
VKAICEKCGGRLSPGPLDAHDFTVSANLSAGNAIAQRKNALTAASFTHTEKLAS